MERKERRIKQKTLFLKTSEFSFAVTRTGIDLRRRPGLDGDRCVDAALDRYRSDFTAVPAALSEQWNLPRANQVSPGHLVAPV